MWYICSSNSDQKEKEKEKENESVQWTTPDSMLRPNDKLQGCSTDGLQHRLPRVPGLVRGRSSNGLQRRSPLAPRGAWCRLTHRLGAARTQLPRTSLIRWLPFAFIAACLFSPLHDGALESRFLVLWRNRFWNRYWITWVYVACNLVCRSWGQGWFSDLNRSHWGVSYPTRLWGVSSYCEYGLSHLEKVVVYACFN